MTSKEILDGNILIAKFMGHGVYFKDGNIPIVEIHSEKVELLSEWAKYHIYFDMLIPVYNKILQTVNNSTFLKTELNNEKNMVIRFAINNFFVPFENQLSISSCWLKAVDFINFHNKVTKP